MTKAKGTFACPICGHDKPHHHPDKQVAAYREDQVRNDGWISTAHRQPNKGGWYLCLGVEVPNDYGKNPDDGFLAHQRWSVISWLNWVRNGGAICGRYTTTESEIQEVLFYDHDGVFRGWRLRNLLGNAVPSGAESRFAVYAKPKYWRELPAGLKAHQEP